MSGDRTRPDVAMWLAVLFAILSAVIAFTLDPDHGEGFSPERLHTVAVILASLFAGVSYGRSRGNHGE